MSNRSQTGIPGLSRDASNAQIVDKINEMNKGKLNLHKDITLNTSSTSTPFTDSRISANCFIDFMPQTSDAAAARSSIWISGRKKGFCTINHQSNTNSDLTYTTIIVGP